MEGLIYISNHFHGNAAINMFFKLITNLGSGGVFWLAFAAVLLIFKKTRKCAIVMLLSLALGHIFNEYILKSIFSRPRPFTVHPEFLDFLKSMGLEPPNSFSFPSGHAFSSFNCAVVIALFHKKLGYISIPMAFLIAFSRVFFCIHYPTDVLTGAILGVVFAVGFTLLALGLIRKLRAIRRDKVRERK